MSEIRRPQPESPWNEGERALQIFKGGMDEIFERYFDDVDRGMAWEGKLLESLDLKEKTSGNSFILTRTIDTDLDPSTEQNTHYGLHMKADGNNYLYRIKFGLVHKLFPTLEEMNHLDLDIHRYAIGDDPEELNDQPVTSKDVLHTLELARKANVPPRTFDDVVNNHRRHNSKKYSDDLEEEHLIELVQDEEHSAMTVNFFNYSIDEFMDQNSQEIKKEDTTEVLQKIVREDANVLVVTVARDKKGETFDDRRVIMVFQDEHSSTQMLFQLEDDYLHSSERTEYLSYGDDSISHSEVTLNAARDLIKFIKDPTM